MVHAVAQSSLVQVSSGRDCTFYPFQTKRFFGLFLLAIMIMCVCSVTVLTALIRPGLGVGQGAEGPIKDEGIQNHHGHPGSAGGQYWSCLLNEVLCTMRCA